MIVIVILGIIAFIILLIFLINAWLTKRRIIRAFRKGNVIVDGKKGNGKDVLFQEVIRKRKEHYTANISYGYKFDKEQWPKDFNVDPNTYVNFINNEIKTIPKEEGQEGIDYYLSDGGIVLPSQMDSTLHKQFPSFPIYYALSRHLYAKNMHINTQNLERVWKAIREQADYFVRCRGVIKIPFFLIIKTTEYDRYQSAVNDVRAYHGGGFQNKFNSAERATYQASNGFIQDGFVIVPKWGIKYDTRAYHKKLFGYEAPKK